MGATVPPSLRNRACNSVIEPDSFAEEALTPSSPIVIAKIA
jgi:hypothetical protein